MAIVCCSRDGAGPSPSRVARGVIGAVGLALVCSAMTAADEPAEAVTVSHAERMAALGWIRYRGSWRTAQEIEIIERKEAVAAAERQWTGRLARLRGQLEKPALADQAAEELREISDPRAVPALAAALATEPVGHVRAWYLESLARIGTPDAVQVAVTVALDHPDPETRLAAADQLVAIGPAAAVPRLAAALASPDNAQVNRAADALGRLGSEAAILPLIAALETRHVSITPGPPAGSTSATFSPTGGGGLSMGGGPTQRIIAVRNERVLAALVAITRVNFEWDAAAWRTWLAGERSLPPDFDPRRG